jgi:hypothetical protein
VRVLIVTMLAAALLGAVLPGAALPTATTSTAAAGTGAWGFVTRGPIAPVCIMGTPCTGPAKHVRLVFTRDGAVAGQVTTDEAGKYRLALAPGTYAVRLAARAVEPNHARVFAGRWARVDFSYDTGIR